MRVYDAFNALALHFNQPRETVKMHVYMTGWKMITHPPYATEQEWWNQLDRTLLQSEQVLNELKGELNENK